MGDIAGSQILNPQTCLYLGFNSVIAAPHVIVPCPVIWLIYSYLSLQVLQESGHFCFAAVPDRKGPSAFVSLVTVQHFNCNSTKHPCINVVPSDHTAYCKRFCSHAIAHVGHDMIWLLKGFTDITAGQENWCFAEIGPCTVYLLYSITALSNNQWWQCTKVDKAGSLPWGWSTGRDRQLFQA